MQDRYAGDVGDFSKFALMRGLQYLSDRPLGLIWYKHPDEHRTNDGRHVSYLTDARWEKCDAELVQMLAGVVSSGERKIAALEAIPLFARSAVYVSEPCWTDARDRSSHRLEWFEKARHAVKECEILFVDPDNGIRLNANPKLSAKHIHQDEFVGLAEGSDVLVAYHHFDRSCSHLEQMRRLTDALQAELPLHTVSVLRYKRISPRAYVCAVRKHQMEAFEGARAGLTSRPWDFHFEQFVD